LAGFSHGSAGITWALLELGNLTGEKRFIETAFDSINYERSLYSRERLNWPDLRTFGDETPFQNNKDGEHGFVSLWCHGAAGIGLSRLWALNTLDDQMVEEEIDIAINTTLRQGFGLNHSLCHGDLGNLDFLLTASLILEDTQLKAHVYRIASMILESIDKYGWVCGVPLKIETPGLMVGLAGIGYELLRLAEPFRVPSVLSLEPPPGD
jgi:lantibiotic modifying enzyme